MYDDLQEVLLLCTRSTTILLDGVDCNFLSFSGFGFASLTSVRVPPWDKDFLLLISIASAHILHIASEPFISWDSQKSLQVLVALQDEHTYNIALTHILHLRYLIPCLFRWDLEKSLRVLGSLTRWTHVLIVFFRYIDWPYYSLSCWRVA